MSLHAVTGPVLGPGGGAVEAIAADTTDTQRLAVLAEGAAVLYNCACPPYSPVAGRVAAAGRLGARGCRAQRRRAGDNEQLVWLRACRPPDDRERPAGRRPGQGHRGQGLGHFPAWSAGAKPHRPAVDPRLLAGHPISVRGDPDTPHSWTYLADIAPALVTLGGDERAWGRAWHVPTNPPLTRARYTPSSPRSPGHRPPRLLVVRGWQTRALGLAIPYLREFGEVSHQFTKPLIVDSTAFQATFGIEPRKELICHENPGAASATRRLPRSRCLL